MDLETRTTNLEKRINYLYSLVNRNQFYTGADIDGARQGISENTTDIAENTEGIAVNEDAVCELSETTEASVAELEQAICDLSEEIHTESEAE